MLPIKAKVRPLSIFKEFRMLTLRELGVKQSNTVKRLLYNFVETGQILKLVLL